MAKPDWPSVYNSYSQSMDLNCSEGRGVLCEGFSASESGATHSMWDHQVITGQMPGVPLPATQNHSSSVAVL